MRRDRGQRELGLAGDGDAFRRSAEMGHEHHPGRLGREYGCNSGQGGADAAVVGDCARR